MRCQCRTESDYICDHVISVGSVWLATERRLFSVRRLRRQAEMLNNDPTVLRLALLDLFSHFMINRRVLRVSEIKLQSRR